MWVLVCVFAKDRGELLVGDDTNFLNVGLIVVLTSFPGSKWLRNCVAQCFNCFFLAGVCSHPDRRTNPFGETEDDCSTDTDGNNFLF